MKIAIAEDDHHIRKLIEVILKKQEHELFLFTNGKELIEKNPGVDLYILDLMMPEMGGFETLDFIRKSGIKTPVLILSAKGQKDLSANASLYEANEYLKKPFSIEELIKVVNKLIYG